MPLFQQRWAKALQQRSDKGLMRVRKQLQSPQLPEARIDGQQVLSFCSNDYLGFANHPALIESAHRALDTCGVGGGASHLVCGHHLEHDMLEQELAEFTGRDRALVFSSGYMANLAVVSALVSKGDWVFQDKLNHASLIDGGLLSGARFQRYLHNDHLSLSAYLDKKFSRSESTHGAMVVTDGVFSMDGDVADLPGLVSLCQKHDALLVVDDAHGIGFLGKEGRGTIASFGLGQKEVPVLVGTFGKAFGTSGAFVAGSHELIDYLVQHARPYIYTTAMPPSIAAATRTSLRLIRSADAERAHLNALINYFRKQAASLGLGLMDSSTPIQPVIVGDNHAVLKLGQYLEKNAILVGVIRPPTVPEMTARLRITLSARHSFEHVDALITQLAAAQNLGLLSGN